MANILIVEDQGILARDISETVLGFNYGVSGIAKSGEEALDLVRLRQPDLILMDIKLSGKMDGIDVANKIREMWHIPVIFLTAYADDSTLDRAKLSESFGYILKPFENRELKTAIEMALYKNKVEKERRASAEKLHKQAKVLEQIHDAVISTDLNGLIQTWNTGAERVYGYSALETIGQNVSMLYFPEDLTNGIKDDVFKPLITEEGREVIVRQRRNDGREIYVDLRLSFLLDSSGDRVAIIGCSHDITERRRSTQKLAAAEAFTTTVLNSLSSIVVVLDEDGVIQQVNDSWKLEARQRSAVDEVVDGIGLNYFDILEKVTGPDKNDAQKCASGLRAVLDGKQHAFEMEYPCHNEQQERWFLLRALALNYGGKGLVLSHIEISALKRTEADLVQSAEENRRLRERLHDEAVYLREEIKREHNFEEIIGDSHALNQVLLEVEQIGPTDTTVLILGETGTGKELFARAIHAKSKRQDAPFIKVNCAALPAYLIESELFGHERGAFTGARGQRRGRFELANGGTILLDEIGELPLGLQPKLLRVLQEGEFERLGSEETLNVNVRVLAATNRDLAADVREGKFREDLYYRLEVFPLRIPSLRDRQNDIELLARFLLRKFNNKIGKEIKRISQPALKSLLNYDWPGNIRELENVIERAVITTNGPELHLTEKLATRGVSDNFSIENKTLEEVERGYIIQVLEKTNWQIEGDTGAAQVLGLPPSTLRNRIRKLKIRRSKSALIGA